MLEVYLSTYYFVLPHSLILIFLQCLEEVIWMIAFSAIPFDHINDSNKIGD